MGPAPDAHGGDVRAELEELRRRVQQSDDEIDAMQIAASNGERSKWYRNPGIVISIFALTFSLVTTGISYVRLGEDQKHAARTELTGYIERLAEIPRLQAQVVKDNPGLAGSDLFGQLNAEMQSVANQARTVISGIPNDVLSVEYMQVGYAFQQLGRFEDAEALYNSGYTKANNSQDRIIALRSLAAIRFLVRDFTAGRSVLQKALEEHNSDAQPAPLIVASDNFQTQLFWANYELASGNCTDAAAHANAAAQILAAQPMPNLNVNLQLVQESITSCTPVAPPAPVPTAAPA